jgi:hypothetical protein
MFIFVIVFARPSQRPWGSHRKTDIIELIDKPMVIMASDQDQLFCCWTIVQVAGDHIIPGTRTSRFLH